MRADELLNLQGKVALSSPAPAMALAGPTPRPWPSAGPMSLPWT